MLRILFICKRRSSYGVSYGLLNSARLVAETLNSMPGVIAKNIEVHDNNCIDREVALFKPTHVVIEALWVVPEKFKVLTRLHPLVKWIVRIHSKPSFIANEGIAMEWLAAYTKIPHVYVSANDEEFSRSLSVLLDTKVLYTPNIYYPIKRTGKIENNSKYLHVGCFGAIRPMKNHLTQAIAAIEFAKHLGKKLVFHINGDRVEQKGDTVRKNLRALFDATHNTILIEHPWKSHQEFLQIVANMDIGMQVSLTETFNIVSADLVSLGVPIVVCDDISWAPCVCKAEPTSVDDIVSAMHDVWSLRRVLPWWARFNLARWNKHATCAWKKLLFRCVGLECGLGGFDSV